MQACNTLFQYSLQSPLQWLFLCGGCSLQWTSFSMIVPCNDIFLYTDCSLQCPSDCTDCLLHQVFDCVFFPLVVTCKGRFWQWVSVSVTSKFYKNIHSRKNLYNIMFRWPNLTHIFGSIGYNYYCPLCACAFPALQTRWRPFEINSSGKIRKDARDCFSSAVSVCQNL